MKTLFLQRQILIAFVKHPSWCGSTLKSSLLGQEISLPSTDFCSYKKVYCCFCCVCSNAFGHAATIRWARWSRTLDRFCNYFSQCSYFIDLIYKSDRTDYPYYNCHCYNFILLVGHRNWMGDRWCHRRRKHAIGGKQIENLSSTVLSAHC